jgi:hypothetical protein
MSVDFAAPGRAGSDVGIHRVGYDNAPKTKVFPLVGIAWHVRIVHFSPPSYHSSTVSTTTSISFSK